jgi:arylsulfatase A-like enzyme
VKVAAASTARPGPAGIVLPGVWFALLAGFIEAGVLLARHLDGRFIHRSRDFLWMTPAGYLILFALPVLLLWLLYRSGRIGFQTAVTLLATGAASSVLLVLLGGKLHFAALILIGLGAGLQVGRLAQRRMDSFSRMTRRTVPVMLVVVVLAWLGTLAQRRWAEARAMEELPTAAAGAPNIVLIILDTVRAASLSLYGYEKETSPELERWARRGVVFDNAISAAPWTLPSHATLFTGQLPPDHSADWQTPLDERWPTLAEALRNRGYRTGGFVANLIYATWEHGLTRGFDHYEDYPFSFGMLLRHTVPGRKLTDARRLREILGNDEVIGRKPAAQLGHDFLSWLGRDSTRPFFAFLNYYDAHDPYLPPQDYYRKFAGRYREHLLSPLRRGGPFIRRLSAEDLRLEVAAYDGAIAYLDAELGKLFLELESRGILDRTLVIVTSDHGEEFGEHDAFFHGHTLYRQTLHVPLMLLGLPGLPAGRRIPQTASLRDLPATVMGLLQLPDSFPGNSLSRFWTGGVAAADSALSYTSKGIRIPAWLPSSGQDMRSLTTDSLHYIQGKQEMLFQWRNDPAERSNLVGYEESRELVTQLRLFFNGSRNSQ